MEKLLSNWPSGAFVQFKPDSGGKKMSDTKIPLRDLFKSLLGSFCLDCHDFLKMCPSLSEEERRDLESFLDASLSEHQRKADCLVDGFILELEVRLRGLLPRPILKVWK